MLDVYIPIDRRIALATGTSLAERTIGSMLFADISGFTPLTEMLARVFGPRRGAEEITRQLNHIYNLLAATVERYHGSIVGFSGDAITCWFAADDGTGTDGYRAALRATTCALQMQAGMRQFAHLQLAPGEPVRLAMKVAIASGPVRRMLVGDPAIQMIDVMAGSTLDRMAALEQRAARGEVRVDQVTADMLARTAVAVGGRAIHSASDGAVINQLLVEAEPAPWPTSDTLSAEQHRPWLWPTVYERLLSGQGTFVAELRPAAMLFLKFDGIDYDHDDNAGTTLDAYIRWVQSVLLRYDGTLIQLTTGDKGCYIYVAFGVPISHENDTARAVGAASELREPPPAAGLPPMFGRVQVGVSRGMVYAGEYGGATRRIYGAIGDEANLTARLMQRAAPGEVIVSERAAVRTDRLFSYKALGSIAVKGKAEMVPVFSLLGHIAAPAAARRDLPGPTPVLPLVGRASEREQLQRCLDHARHGEPSGPVVIEGEAGIGKSRLVEEVLRLAADAGIRCLTGAGDAIERSSPYHAWRPMFSQLFAIEPLADDLERRRAAVLARLKAWPELLPLAALLNAILPLDLPESALTRPMLGQVRADNIATLLTRLLQEAASPLLLLIEDAHWLDSSSWALLVQVARDLPSDLVIVTTRPVDDPDPALARLRAYPSAIELRLGALDANDISLLIRQRLGVAELPAQVVELIQSRAEGNPFFSEELAFALRDAGVLRLEPSGSAPGALQHVSLAQTNLRELSLPDTVEGVITSRIDRLAPALGLTLKVASVIGRIFTEPLLRAIHPREETTASLIDHLNNMVRLDLMLTDGVEPDLDYLFKHVITQEVAYNLLLFSQRRELHAAVARWHERRFTDDLSPFYAVLAHHWLRAESPTKAMEYLEKAADQALSRGAFKEARDFYATLLELTIEPAEGAAASYRRGRWLSGLAHAYRGLGLLAETRRYGEQAAAVFDQPVPRRPLLSLLAEIARQVGHRLLPGRLAHPAASDHERAALEEASRIYRELTSAYWSGNNTLLNLYTMVRRLNVAEHMGPSEHLLESYGMMAFACHAVRLHGLGRRYAKRVEATTTQVDAPLSLALALNAISLGLFGIGDYEGIRRNTARSEELYHHFGDWRGWGESVIARSTLASAEGDYLYCLERCDEVLSVARRSGNVLHQLWAFLGRAGALLRLGRLDDAILAAEQVLALCETNAERIAEISSCGLIAQAHLQLGQRDAARQMAARAAALIAPSPTPSASYAYDGYFNTARVFLALWELADAAEKPVLAAAARQACGFMRSLAMAFPNGQAGLQLCQGLRAWCEGKPAAAYKALRRSLASARKFKLVYEEGLSLYELGRCTSGVERRQYLEAAIMIWERLGAADDLARARSALRLL